MSGYVMRITSAEASGPSGAGDLAGAGRNPRLDNAMRIVAPPRWRYRRPLLAPCLCGCSEKAS